MEFGLVLDIFVLLVILASVMIAFMRGFIREILTIFGIVGGMAAAYIGGPLLTPTMRGWFGVVEGEEDPEKLFGAIPYSMVADLLSYGAILVVFVIILSVISHFLAEFVKNLGLGALDRSLGVVFGLARGVLVLGLLYLMPYFLVGDEQKDEWFAGSKSRIYLEGVSQWMAGFMPENTEEGIKQGAETLETVSETRKKLEEMNVLNPIEDGGVAGHLKSSSDALDGYTSDFRDKMDALIENNIDGSDTKDAE